MKVMIQAVNANQANHRARVSRKGNSTAWAKAKVAELYMPSGNTSDQY